MVAHRCHHRFIALDAVGDAVRKVKLGVVEVVEAVDDLSKALLLGVLGLARAHFADWSVMIALGFLLTQVLLLALGEVIAGQLQLADALPLTVVAEGCAGLPAVVRHGLDDALLETSFPSVRHVIPCA